MSNRDVRRVSLKDIQIVQNLIERCLQLYMTQSEVVRRLEDAKIEPGFTELVWQKLETENPDFFKAYHLRLLVKDQISRFNQLLERQVELTHQMRQTGAPNVPLSNGSQIQQMHVYPNGGAPTLQSSMTSPTGRFDVPSNTLLAQCSNAVPMQGMNGGIVKSEAIYSGDSSYMFGADNNNLLEPHAPIKEGSVSNFNGVGPGSAAFNDTVFDQDSNSFGFLGQIPRNFSLSDLAADFTNSTDILEAYSGSPYLGTDANFLDPHVRGEHQDISRLDTISEGFSYDNFGSD